MTKIIISLSPSLWFCAITYMLCLDMLESGAGATEIMLWVTILGMPTLALPFMIHKYLTLREGLKR